VLGAPWEAIGEAFTAEQAESGAAVQESLKRLNPAWNVVGRVHFNLAENRKDEEALTFRLRVYRSLRLPRDLHEPALGGRPGPAPAPRPDARRVHGARGSLQLPEFKSSTSGSARSRRARAGAPRGVTSNLRYTTRAEKERLVAPKTCRSGRRRADSMKDSGSLERKRVSGVAWVPLRPIQLAE
jgi:hypothetical protein